MHYLHFILQQYNTFYFKKSSGNSYITLTQLIHAVSAARSSRTTVSKL